MKKILFLFVAIQLSLSGIAFGQAKTYFHDRIDTTIFAVADTVGHGSNNYYATNTSPDFNVNHYENGLNVILFIKPGNSGPATLTLVTRTGTLSTRSIRKSPGAVLASGDIKDSCTMLFTYYNGHWRLGDMIPASSSSWMLTGNAGTVAATNFLGTTDAVDFVIRTNNTEKARISSAGVLSLGLASTNNGSLLFRNSTNANTLTINSGVTSASYALTLPTAQGAANSLLLNDGAGTLSWNTGAGLFWGLTGNAGTVAGANFVGTTDAQDVVFKRNSSEAFRVYGSNRFIGINNSAPTAPLQITNTFTSTAIYPEVFLNNTSGTFCSLLAGSTGNAVGFDVASLGLDIASITGVNTAGYTTRARFHPNGYLSLGAGHAFSGSDLIYAQASSNGILGMNLYNASTGASAYTTIYFGAGSITPTNGLVIGEVGSGNSALGGAGSGFLYNNGNYSITFGTNALERMRLNNSGELGINMTAASAEQLSSKSSTSTSASFAAAFYNSSSTALFKMRGDGVNISNVRFELTQGTDVASSSTITLTYTGNSFELTGTTAVDFITPDGWQLGSEVVLIANENVTINDDAGGGNIRLAGNANFAMTADDVLTLIYSETTAGGTIWREKSRSAN